MTEILHGRAHRLRTAAAVAGIAIALLGGMLLATGLALFPAGDAEAAPSDFSVSKADGVMDVTVVRWDITLTNNSNSSEVVQVSDTFQANNTGTVLLGFEYFGDISVDCAPATTATLDCNVMLGAGETAVLQVLSSQATLQCQDRTAFNSVVATQGGQPISGSPDTASFTFEGEGECPGATFELCKQWFHNGSVPPAMAFSFSVTDAQETEIVPIPSVAPGGGLSCIFVSAAIGVVEIAEVVPPSGFATPDWAFNNVLEGTGTAEFLLTEQNCFLDTSPSLTRGSEALVSVESSGPANCRITFINESVEVPTVTTTPPPAVCVVCNQITPPAATSTPVPPTNTPAPNTPIPPTATPTTSSGTQNPGLTDEQRTATAVAGAKTAAAAITPIAPKTGEGGSVGGGQGANLALILVAMAMVGGGLSLIASRRR